MSYDLAVYTRLLADPEGLGAVIGDLPGLRVDHADARSLRVLRGARGRYSFTVDGPDRLGADDVPEDVTQALLGARYLWSIAVEGSAASELPHAVKFARRLAQALDGAVLDPQEEEVWCRSRSRRVVAPARRDRVSEVTLHWFCLRDRLTDDVIRCYLDAARHFVPEALPRRFGDHEPLQGRYRDGGAEGFEEAWRATDSTFSFSCAGPCVGGHLDAGPAARNPEKFWTMSLSFHAQALDDAAWRDAVRSLFLRVADGMPAFYATAQVARDHIWTGRSLWADSTTESALLPVLHRKGWMGFPPYPLWWHWLGAPFEELIPLLPAESVSRSAAGHLYEASEQPRARDELPPLTTWLPQELFAGLVPNPGGWPSVQLEEAARVLDVLR